MKHILINKFLRNEKNVEAPTNWPDNIKKIEQEAIELKKITQDLTKRLLLCPVFSGCYHSNSIVGSTSNVWNPNWSKMPIDSDKISKKVAEQNLGQCLLLASERLALLNPNVSKILSMLGDTNNKLGMERLNWAANVENNVLEKLRLCYDDSVPALLKSRRQLWKQNSDFKAIQDKLKSVESNSSILSPNSPILPHNSSIHSTALISSSQTPIESSSTTSVLNSSLNCVSNSNNQNGQISSSHENSKLNQLKAARDDLETQIDHLKDLSLREHYRFESSIIDISKGLVNLLRNEANYHQQCLKIIGQVLPDLESSIGNNPIPVFGRELSQHLLTSRRHIAYTLEVCIRQLDNPETLFEEGLFRIAGGKNKVDTLSSAFNVFRAEKIIDQYDHFVIADCLKQYLRSLPQPLLTHHLFDDWMRTFNHEALDARLTAIKICLGKLPVAYFNNLSYLIGFLSKLSTFSDNNKMTPANLGIIFGPNLLSADSSSSGLYNLVISSTNTVRKKLRSVSNASQMIKKQAVSESTRTQASVDNNGMLSMGEYGRTKKQTNQWDEHSMSKSMIATNHHCLVIETLITHFNYFFPNQSTQFTMNIPPKVFPHTYRTKRQSSFNGLGSNDKVHNNHKINLPSSVKSIQCTESNVNFYLKSPIQNSSMSSHHHRRISVDSSTTTEQIECDSILIAKSLATTPTGKKTSDFRNGTAFPSCLYHRRVSEGTLDNLKTSNDDNFIGCIDISDLPDIDSSCIEDYQSSSAKSSNDCDDTIEYGSNFTAPMERDIAAHSISSSAKYVPKSFHADVYDTLFALQSLNSYTATADDYLNRVRSAYEERTLSKPPGISQTPLIRRQTINMPVIEDPMSKSVTNDSCLQFSNVKDSTPSTKISVIRRPKPLMNTKLKNYRESSPANIQTLSTDSIDLVTCKTLSDCNDTFPRPLNKLSLEAEDSPVQLSSIMRYSMPILPAKYPTGHTHTNN